MPTRKSELESNRCSHERFANVGSRSAAHRRRVKRLTTELCARGSSFGLKFRFERPFTNRELEQAARTCCLFLRRAELRAAVWRDAQGFAEPRARRVPRAAARRVR